MTQSGSFDSVQVVGDDMMKYFFLCSKFSDLDNMLPVLFQLVRTEPECSAEILWYSSGVPDNAAELIEYVSTRYPEQVVFWTPPSIDKQSPKKSLRYRLSRLVRRIADRFCSEGRQSENSIKDEIQTHIKKLEAGGEFNSATFFFGFKEREILSELASSFNSRSFKWVRLPQGVVVTVSTFRDNNNLFKPVSPDSFLPDWADFGIDVYKLLYDKINAVRGVCGFEPVAYDGIRFLGSPRYSREWIECVDQAYGSRTSEFSLCDNTKKNVLFLITPWQKCIWKEEVLRLLDIMSSFDVNLVVKGFHGNTSLPSEGKYRVDEESPTSVLIREADAVVYIATSAALEAYVRRKEVLQLSYAHASSTILEDFSIGVRALCRDDVITCMHNLVQHSTFSLDPAAKARAEEFVMEKIVGNSPMRAYADYIIEKSDAS